MKRLSLIIALLFPLLVAAEDGSIVLHPIQSGPKAGVSWGVPFLRGEIRKDTKFILMDNNGKASPVQQWVMASWSDGSPKWIGFASVPDTLNDQLMLMPLARSEERRVAKEFAAESIKSIETESAFIIDNGLFQCTFPKTGEYVIESICYGDNPVALNGRLLLQTEDRSRWNEKILSYKDYTTNINKVTLEQNGPVRAVVKVEGDHFTDKVSTDTVLSLPFTLRFYIYYNDVAIQLTHSFLYDGNPQCDFVKGLGVHFDIPFREEVHNRHVFFSGDRYSYDTIGLWHEPVQPLVGRRVLRPSRSMEERRQDYPMKRPEDRRPEAIQRERENLRRYGLPPQGPSVYHRQMACERIADREEFDESGQALLREWAVWNDFKLTQLNCDGFSIQKRTQQASPWIYSDGGYRATGLVLAGDVSGGLAVSLKDFWQSYPVALEVSNAASRQAGMDIWMWSPEAPAMDLRHYDTIPHGLNASYEDVQEGLSTPYGIGRTHTLTLYPYNAIPSRETVMRWSERGANPPRLLCTPAYYHAKKAFGAHWSLPYNGWASDSVSAVQAGVSDTVVWLETQLDKLLAFYEQAVEDNRWYGFWNYGDVMHSYDGERHSWLYDVGGFAWDNTELAPEMWLWYSFLRTGRSDVFRMAEAMSRHTAEVDVYHAGSLKGLGSRHNVSHWGCGAKEARIAQAGWKRFYAYLTTDERMGDLMHEVTDADWTTLQWDPLRIAKPRSQFPSSAPARLRWGPDWTSFAANWFIEWERTGNKKYLDKLMTGMNCLAALPAGCFTGQGPLGYYPETGKIIYEGPEGATDHTLHLATIMGGFELFAEMLDDIDNPAFQQCWYNYCLYYSMPENDPMRTQETADWGPITSFNTPRLTAYAGWKSGDETLKARAWEEFLRGRRNPYFDITIRPLFGDLYGSTLLQPSDILHTKWEIPNVGTNGSAQWSLNAIFLMTLAK